MTEHRKKYMAEYRKRYREKHGDILRQKSSDYYQTNRLTIRAKVRAKTNLNPTPNRERVKRWRLDNRDKSNAQHRAWRSRNKEKTARRFQEWKNSHPIEYAAQVKKLASLERNPLQRAAYNKEYRERRKEYFKAKSRQWQDKVSLDPQLRQLEKIRQAERSKRWYDRNPEHAKIVCSGNKKRKLGARGFHSVEQWMARVSFYGWKCFYCDGELTVKTLQKDHRIPLAKGGTDWASNLVPACKSCNSSKRHLLPAEFEAFRKVKKG